MKKYYIAAIILSVFGVLLVVFMVMGQEKTPPIDFDDDVIPVQEVTPPLQDFETPEQGLDTSEQDSKTPVQDNDQGCVRAGCSNELCIESELADDIFTTCEYKPEYACYQQAVCTRLETGECGFVYDEALLTCLAEATQSGSLLVE